MKYIVVLGDGMADYPQPQLNGKTPLTCAKKDEIDSLCAFSEMGLVKTIPCGLKPGSDVANLSVLGYDTTKCYTGRSPLEAASIGINVLDTDITARANLVTLSDDENYEDKTMIDYSAGEISTVEAKELIDYLAKNINCDKYKLYSGVSYRHCLVVDNGRLAGDLTPPHDILDRKIKDYLPKSEIGQFYIDLQKQSAKLLKDHPVNIERIKKGKRPATSLWFWGEGTKPCLENFEKKTGLKAGMISAVDLLKGIAILSGMKNIEVEGATGNYDTNFSGKAKACFDNLMNGLDFVYIHMEGPDECGHQGDTQHKIFSIEEISKKVVGYLKEQLDKTGERYKMLIAPDHPTPLSLRTHCSDPVPFLIYDSGKVFKGAKGVRYDEESAKSTGIFVGSGVELMKKFLEK